MSRENRDSHRNSVRQARVPERPMNDSVRRHVPLRARVAGHAGWGHEMTRLATFVGWPSNHPCSAIKLANNGFCYTGDEDEIICHDCGLTVRHWGPEQEPFDVHFRQSSRCAFFSNQEERYNSSLPQSNLANTQSRSQDADLTQSFPQDPGLVNANTEPEISSDQSVIYDIGARTLSTSGGRDQAPDASARESSPTLYYVGSDQTAAASTRESHLSLHSVDMDQTPAASSRESSLALYSVDRDHTAAAADDWNLLTSTAEAGFDTSSTGFHFTDRDHNTQGFRTNDMEPVAMETDVIDLQAERLRREVGVNLRHGRVRSRDGRHLRQSDLPGGSSLDFF